MNRVSVRLDNEPEPTWQRAISSRLLSPFGNRHFSNYVHQVMVPRLVGTFILLCYGRGSISLESVRA